MFEIREYLDEAGNVAGPGEVVDLQRELEQFQGVLDSKQEAAAAAPAGDEKAEAARKALHELTQKMRSLGAANLGADDAAGGGGGGGGFDDPDAAFIRELHTLQEAQAAAAAAATATAAHQPEDASDIFDRLAALEAQAATSKDKERSGISSSGWGKGFFGKDKAAAAAATAAKPKPAAAAPAPAPAPAPVPAGPVAFSGGIVEKGF